MQGIESQQKLKNLQTEQTSSTTYDQDQKARYNSDWHNWMNKQ